MGLHCNWEIGRICVLVLYCCCNKLQQTHWLKTAQIYFFQSSVGQKYKLNLKKPKSYISRVGLLQLLELPVVFDSQLHHSSFYFSHHIMFSLLHIWTFMTTFRAHMDNLGESPHLRIFNLIMWMKSLLPHKVIYSEVSDIGM